MNSKPEEVGKKKLQAKTHEFTCWVLPNILHIVTYLILTDVSYYHLCRSGSREAERLAPSHTQKNTNAKKGGQERRGVQWQMMDYRKFRGGNRGCVSVINHNKCK